MWRDKKQKEQKTATNPGIIHIRIGVLNTCDTTFTKVSITSNNTYQHDESRDGTG